MGSFKTYKATYIETANETIFRFMSIVKTSRKIKWETNSGVRSKEMALMFSLCFF